MAILASEIEMKKDGESLEESIMARGIINLISETTTYALTVMKKTSIENHLRKLVTYTLTHVAMMDELGIDADVPEKPEKPRVLSEDLILEMERMLIKKKTDQGEIIFAHFNTPDIFKEAQRLLLECKRKIARFKLKMKFLSSWAKKYPETTVSIPIMMELADLISENLYSTEYRRDPLDFLSVFQEMYSLMCEVAVLEAQKNLPTFDDLDKKKMPYRAYYVTKIGCPVCQAVASSPDFWKVLGTVEKEGYKVVILEIPKTEAYLFAKALHFRVVPSLILRMTVIHGISPYAVGYKGLGIPISKDISIRKIAQTIIHNVIPSVVFYDTPEFIEDKLRIPVVKYYDRRFLFEEWILEKAKEGLFMKLLS